MKWKRIMTDRDIRPLSHFEKVCKRYPDGIRATINMTREENKTISASAVSVRALLVSRGISSVMQRKSCSTFICLSFWSLQLMGSMLHFDVYLVGQITKRKALRTSRCTHLLHCYYTGWIVSQVLLCTHTSHFDSYFNPLYKLTVVIGLLSSGLWHRAVTCIEPSFSLHCRHLPAQYQSCNDVMYTMMRMMD
jgi:hypothetical protein